MKILIISLVLGLSLTSKAQNEKPIIIVELFTSEGCSSCPPADRLLSKMVNDNDLEAEVIGLSFHVDYWDYIGWKDPYANKDFTLRQRAYAEKFGLNTIYTPQMIVNGSNEFVGSNYSKWKAAYKEATNNSMDILLEVRSISLQNQKLSFTVKSNNISNALLNVAVVEKELSQNVTRGENRGRTLSHDNVVRVYDKRSFDGKANAFSLRLPNDLNMENVSLIVYSQNSKNWSVNGAKKINLASIIN